MNQWNQSGPPGNSGPSEMRGLTWLWVTLAAVGGLAVGCIGGAGVSAATGPSQARSVAPVAPGDEAPSATTEVAAAPTGPLTTFGGTSVTGSSQFEIGTGPGQVPPGRYFTDGGAYCYFELTRTGTGKFGDIVTNKNVGEGQAFVTIPATGAGFITVDGVCTFAPK